MGRRGKTGTQPTDNSTQVEALDKGDDDRATVENHASEPTSKSPPVATEHKPPGGSPVVIYKRIARWYWGGRLWTLPATLLLVLLLDLAMPVGGYPLLGIVIKVPTTFSVVDSVTNRPVASASVQFGGMSVDTTASGIATVNLPLGHITVHVNKSYYTAESSTVWSTPGGSHRVAIRLVAIGRQVPITVLNRISSEPVEGAVVKALNAEAVTDKKGQAVIVLPSDAATQQGTVSGKGYNDASITIKVTDQVVADNIYTVVPEGSFYFLSNLSGNIDVVKTNLDGTDRKTVVAGTGYEVPTNTVLLASRDWKYLALYSTRKKGGNQEINLIDTVTDKMTNIDEGDANFTIVGWDGDNFIYVVNRTNVKVWQNGHQVIKSFDAPHKSITVIASTIASGGQYSYTDQYFNVYILDDKVTYITNWDVHNSDYYYYSDGGASLSGKSLTIRIVDADGTNNSLLKSFALGYNIYFSFNLYDEPNVMILRYQRSSGTDYYELRGDKLAISQDIKDDTAFYGVNNNTTYLESPSGQQTLWQQPADGKYALYVGDHDGKNSKAVATLVDYAPYGWYTNDYILVSKNGSELYIMSATGGTAVRVTDYFKSAQYYRGYGGGYGGL